MKKSVLFLLLSSCSLALLAQHRATPNSATILHNLRKVQDVSSALYVAAHPDDENTRLITYLANAELAETAYLSLTRGDGGQNLIGTDIREGLGVIRTQELLAARRIDGGKQFFSRANDFGFSKHPDETLNFWDRDSILNDMVWVIRKWQPDIIVTRFDPESAGRTHGHHTASAMLAVEAFDLAADPKKYPEHFAQGVKPWQAKRILFNTSWWFYGSREKFAAADKSDLFMVDAGAYYPLLGQSTGEIAAKSRSSHSSQGFGSSSSRGTQMEYMKFLKGEDAEDHTDLFAGINDGWSRFEGGKQLEQVLAKAEKEFDALHTAASVPTLVEALELLRKMPANRYTETKIPALEQLIADCLGLYFEVTASDSIVTTGEEVELNYEIVTRAEKVPVELKRLHLADKVLDVEKALTFNEGHEDKVLVKFSGTTSNPYWLEGEASLGMYSAPGYDLRGAGENDPVMNAKAMITVAGVSMTLSTPVYYRITYPDRGEIYRPVLALPEVGASFDKPVYLWASDQAREVVVTFESFYGPETFEAALAVPKGWSVKPAKQTVTLAEVGSRQKVTFSVTPGGDATGDIRVQKVIGRTTKEMPSVQVLRYAHIPLQTMIKPSSSRAVRIEMNRSGKRVGYIMGAGDLVPEALREIGYAVDMLHESDLSERDLSGYDAIVVGIRAYNTQNWLKRLNAKLLAYAKTGGTVVVQYNTSRRIDMAKYSPYPLKLSRKRVTVEEAPITFIDPDATVLNKPNKLSQADFDGWVQERGLYFPEEWDDAYQPILTSNDPGEEPLNGGLLVAAYGEGHYVYTGLSFFRELPAGVPGAYRLFVNLLEL